MAPSFKVFVPLSLLLSGHVAAAAAKPSVDISKDHRLVMLDALKDLGFLYATRSGLSIGIDDLVVPAEKEHLWPRSTCVRRLCGPAAHNRNRGAPP